MARVLAFGWLSVFLIYAAVDGGSVGASRPQAASTAHRPAPSPAEADRTISEPCHELAHLFGPASPLSDLQKDEQWKSYEGRPFKWRLRVVEVRSRIFGGYTVQYTCARSRSLIQDVQVRYSAGRKAFVLSLTKGKMYEITGRLVTQSTLLGLTADGAP